MENIASRFKGRRHCFRGIAALLVLPAAALAQAGPATDPRGHRESRREVANTR